MGNIQIKRDRKGNRRGKEGKRSMKERIKKETIDIISDFVNKRNQTPF
jgi:hypothetical protein